MKRRNALALFGTTVIAASSGMTYSAMAVSSVGEIAAPAEMKNGDQIVSPNGRTRLVMQNDGNAVVYAKDNSVLWTSNTGGNTGARLSVQSDGGLVIYKATQNVVVKVLRAGAAGTTGRKLSVQNDGNVVFYSSTNQALWWTGTVTKPIIYVDSIPAGTEMAYGDVLRSPSSQYRLIMQPDGNLVIYTPGSQIVFQSYTKGTNSKFVPQLDGNLVIYSASGQSVWQTYTQGQGGARLSMQDDGNLVFYRSNGTAAYRSNTFSAALVAGEDLQSGHYLSNNGFLAVMQTDGNFVIRKGSTVSWQTQTNIPGSIAGMQGDGNFVVRNGSNVRWQSATSGRQGARVLLESDGRLIMYRADGASVWNNVNGTAVPDMWRLPFDGTSVVTTEFAAIDSAHSTAHQGIDWGLDLNQPQYAIGDGFVSEVDSGPHGNLDGFVYGNFVKIQHENGVSSLLGHLINGSVTLRVGDRVTRGQVIGRTGNTGKSYGKHCHLSIYLNGTATDPRIFFESRGIAVD